MRSPRSSSANLVAQARTGLWHLRKRSGRALRHVRAELSAARVYVDPLRRPDRAVVVLGSPRSGTTKLAEALASSRTTRFVFEPMNVGNSPFPPPHFTEGQWVEPSETNASLLDVWTRILEGRARSTFTDSRNRSRVSTHRVVKSIASNNLAGWMRLHFPQTPLVYVHRHPFAVIGSILDMDTVKADPKRGRWTAATLPDWVAATRLLSGPLADLEPAVERILGRSRTHFEDRVVRWCMENYLPLVQPPTSGFHTVRFEDLVAEPEQQLRAIGRFAALDVERGIREFDRPSSTDWATGIGNRVGTREHRRVGWRSRISEEDMEAGMAIVQVFGLERYLASA